MCKIQNAGAVYGGIDLDLSVVWPQSQHGRELPQVVTGQENTIGIINTESEGKTDKNLLTT